MCITKSKSVSPGGLEHYRFYIVPPTYTDNPDNEQTNVLSCSDQYHPSTMECPDFINTSAQRTSGYHLLHGRGILNSVLFH